ncbi:FixH family protein [Ruegeria arenilitoris]|uniref:FixH family protein n=1 Tax=Ruegeria arenilitoris TaxID=1173585 RepID=UPI00147C03B3|nr:FixH family protein [Ruegeria arenilitoris]
MIRWVALFLISSGMAVACEATGQRLSSKVLDAPEVHMVVDEVPLAQPFSILISVCDEIAIDTLRVDATMPAHQHGMNYVPKVTELGDGLFRVDDMLFHMPGLWELQVDVGFGGEPVSYTSEVELK